MRVLAEEPLPGAEDLVHLRDQAMAADVHRVAIAAHRPADPADAILSFEDDHGHLAVRKLVRDAKSRGTGAQHDNCFI